MDQRFSREAEKHDGLMTRFWIDNKRNMSREKLPD
jgi:hypothetical protein